MDEVERISDSSVKYIEHYYPLVENNIRIDQIINWFAVNDLPEPGKSACLICPFHYGNTGQCLKDFSLKNLKMLVILMIRSGITQS